MSNTKLASVVSRLLDGVKESMMGKHAGADVGMVDMLECLLSASTPPGLHPITEAELLSLIPRVLVFSRTALLGVVKGEDDVVMVQLRRNLLLCCVLMLRLGAICSPPIDHFALHSKVPHTEAAPSVFQVDTSDHLDVHRRVEEVIGDSSFRGFLEGCPRFFLQDFLNRPTLLQNITVAEWVILTVPKDASWRGDTLYNHLELVDMPADVKFCGSACCMASIACELMLGEFVDTSEAACGPERDGLLSLAGLLFAQCVDKCATAGNLHTAALLRYHVTGTWAMQRDKDCVLRADVKYASMIVACRIAAFSSWRLWDLQVASLALRAMLHTATAGSLGAVMQAVQEVRFLLWDHGMAPGSLLDAVEAWACIGRTLYPASPRLRPPCSAVAVATAMSRVLRDLTWFPTIRLVFRECLMSAACQHWTRPGVLVPLVRHVSMAVKRITTTARASQSKATGTVLIPFWKVFHCAFSALLWSHEEADARALAKALASAGAAKAWWHVLQSLCEAGATARVLGLSALQRFMVLATGKCQALLEPGAQFGQLSCAPVDMVVRSAQFPQAVVAFVRGRVDDRDCDVDWRVVRDVWGLASTPDIVAYSQGMLVAHVTTLVDQDELEAGLQAVFRLVPDVRQWSPLAAVPALTPALKSTYQVYFQLDTIAADMAEALWVFWGQVLCTRAVGHKRAMQVCLQVMTLDQACEGFTRHNVCEAITPAVRAWAKKHNTSGLPVFRDPIRVLADFALDKGQDPAHVARHCPCALAMREQLLLACVDRADAAAIFAAVLSDSVAVSKLSESTRAVLEQR